MEEETKKELYSQGEYNGDVFHAHYVEDDPTHNLIGDNFLQAIHTICFYEDKMVIVFEGKNWGPPGGSIEPKETYQEAVVREVQEESNMRVLHQEYIGYVDVTDKAGKTIRQVRSFCITEPHGDFISDPDKDITEIKLIDPKDYKQYFDWGVIGDRIMERALEIKNKLK
jgi:ADP-ribose pyrophosphatase YjhB (NUDIX family)